MTTGPTEVPSLARRAALLLLATAFPLCAAATIRNTAHDLSASSASTVKSSDSEICKFCHTPHGAASTRLLWNHTPSAYAGAYSWGGSLTTTSGTTLPTTLKPASRTCLGCHDGTVAIGDVRNKGGGAAGVIPVPDVANRVSGGKLVAGNPNLVGAGGSLAGSHPVSIPYAGQTGLYNGIKSAPTLVADSAPGHYWAVATSGCANLTGICTAAPSTGGTNGAVIQLYDDVPGTKTNIGIECESCHEPHNRFGFKWLMRVDAATSDGLCRSCHNK